MAKVGENCDVCLNRGVLTIWGKIDDFLGPHSDRYFAVVVSVIRAIQGEMPFPRTPIEVMDQPAKWMAVFEFLQPFAVKEIEAKRERDK